jgi:hypothetical protein
MSLGKLLASGKSFVNGQRKSAYREDKRAYLPKFGSSKNPFMVPVQAELPKAETKQSAVSCEKVAGPQPVKLAPMKPRVPWTSRLNPVSAWRDSQAVDKSASRPVIQAELSLDTLKVVQNDLSDAEVEIVPIKSRSAREIPAAILSVNGGENSWSRLGAKFFGANAV